MFFFKYSNHYRRYRIWYWMYYLFVLFPQKQTGCLGASFLVKELMCSGQVWRGSLILSEASSSAAVAS